MSEGFRGSRKHVLDWIDDEDSFLQSLNELLHFTGAVVGPTDIWMPKGHQRPKEVKLHAGYSPFLPEDLKTQVIDWWLVHKRGANVPNWDLAATCSVSDRRGLVLIEAKGHENELSLAGKELRQDASDNSRKNHARIGQAIEEARQALDQTIPGVRISRDSHYQLSNRIAYAWKVASLGVPNVLVYLGFIGDTGIDYVGPHFESEEHWDRTVRGYMAAVLPPEFLDRPIPCGAGTMQTVIRSRPVLEPTEVT
jgi:hypothetical protein